MKRVLLLLLSLFIVLLANPANVPLDSIKGPTCVFYDSLTKEALPFRANTSQYNIVITDGFAELTLTQKYVNSYENKSSMTYVFPLPHQGSVNAMSMIYQNNTYEAKIYEKSEADNIFDSLIQEGKTASLLIQDKPNIFTQSISNIASGDSATITIKATLPLNFIDSVYELKIPTMVAKRYGSRNRNNSWNPADSINSREIQINTIIQTDFLLEDLNSPTHELSISQIETKREELDQIGILKKDAHLTQQDNQCALLLKNKTYANRDYILRFKRRDKKVGFSFASYYDKSRNQGYFAMNMYPNDTLQLNDSLVEPKEILILFDISGSQSGWPILKQKDVVYRLLEKLSPQDNIAVMAFNNEQFWAFAPYEVRPATETNLALAREFIANQKPSGGTELYSAIDTYLKTPITSNKQRTFIFLTDGFITNEEEIFARIKSDESSPIIFTYGSGNNLNHYFLEECAKIGHGVSVALTQHEDVNPIVDQNWNKLEFPQIDNIAIDFAMMEVGDIICTPTKKLYKGVPIVCFGAYARGGGATISITGEIKKEKVQFTKEVIFTQDATTHQMLPQLWAKQMIEKLDIEDGTSEFHKDSIITLSLEYQVLSKYTAFLAVNSADIDDGDIETQIMPLSQIKKGLQVNVTGHSLDLNFPERSGITGFTIFDLRGRVIFQQAFSSLNLTNYSWDGYGINGQLIATGSYILQIHTDKGAITTKFHWIQ